MADKTVLLGQIVAEQEDFAALLRGLTDEQWAASSLCEGWTVRDTAIHTAWHIHLKRIGPVPSFGYARDVSQFLLLGGTKFDARQRERDGARSNEDLIDWIASPAEPTLTNLDELMIHQQDARRPLGLGRVIPADRLASLLSYCMSPIGDGGLGVGCGSYKLGREFHLVATDIGWSGGQGLEVRGPGEAILMAINGRSEATDDREGSGVEILASRLAAHANRG